MTCIIPVVEGKGEVEAVPILLRRIAAELGGWVDVARPIRVSSGKLLNDPDEFRSYIGLAANQARARGGHVLLLLDCDVGVGGRRTACPAELGPRLLEEMKALRPDVPMYVALAHREYESWFIAALNSLKGQFGLSTSADAPFDPETRRDAKGQLSILLGRRYGHDDALQPELTRVMSLAEARRAPSFDRLYRWVARLLRASATGAEGVLTDA